MDAKKGKPLSKLQQSRLWQQTLGAAQQFWSNWLKMLRVSFIKMRREEQFELITKLCMILTVGLSMLALSFVYQFLPLLVRVLALPIVLVGAWWIGTRVVPEVIISRISSFLNPK